MSNNLIGINKFPTKEEINKKIKKNKKVNKGIKPNTQNIKDIEDYREDEEEIWMTIIQVEILRLVDQIIELWINQYIQENENSFEDTEDIHEEIDLLTIEMLTKANAIDDTYNYLNEDDENIVYYDENYILNTINDLLEWYTDKVQLILIQNAKKNKK